MLMNFAEYKKQISSENSRIFLAKFLLIRYQVSTGMCIESSGGYIRSDQNSDGVQQIRKRLQFHGRFERYHLAAVTNNLAALIINNLILLLNYYYIIHRTLSQQFSLAKKYFISHRLYFSDFGMVQNLRKPSPLHPMKLSARIDIGVINQKLTSMKEFMNHYEEFRSLV